MSWIQSWIHLDKTNTKGAHRHKKRRPWTKNKPETRVGFGYQLINLDNCWASADGRESLPEAPFHHYASLQSTQHAWQALLLLPHGVFVSVRASCLVTPCRPVDSFTSFRTMNSSLRVDTPAMPSYMCANILLILPHPLSSVLRCCTSCRTSVLCSCLGVELFHWLKTLEHDRTPLDSTLVTSFQKVNTMPDMMQ